MIALLPFPYLSLVLTLGFTYPLCSDIFDNTPQFCLHRAVYVLMDASTAMSSPAQMSLSFATDNLVSLQRQIIFSFQRDSFRESYKSVRLLLCFFFITFDEVSAQGYTIHFKRPKLIFLHIAL